MKKDEKAKIVLLYNKQSTVLQCSQTVDKAPSCEGAFLVS